MNFRKIIKLAISPFIFLTGIWGVQLSAYMFFNIGIDMPSAEAWAIVFSGCVAFAIGALMSYSILFKKKSTLDQSVSLSQSALKLVKLSGFMAVASVIILVYQTDAQGFEIFSVLKENLLQESTSGNKSGIYLVYLIVFNALCVLYYCSTIEVIFRKKTIILLIFTSVLCLFSGSRGLLILFVVALIPLMVFQHRKLTVKALILVLISVILTFSFFFLYPILFQSADFSSNGEVFRNYLSVYLFSGIGAFSHFVDTGGPAYNCILTIPRPFLSAVDLIFSTNLIAACPTYFQETYIPLTTNVYSIFFPAMHDFGILGVVVYLFILGCIVNFAYLRGFHFNSKRWRFIYCLCFYSIFMSFFEDQFVKGFMYYFFAIVVLVFARGIEIIGKFKNN
ncbi:O-antigen polymerase [Collimonas humicola]|uniref:O-antigen polymerase n=1 Tax=Collimonas humicola TaxID=2825886 RepID=UPI001B8C395F|nr:O-antigen polymerase [Collimonas humicola]